MTGPEHWAMAETLEAQAGDVLAETLVPPGRRAVRHLCARAAVLAARAQVHATLARTAAAVDVLAVTTGRETGHMVRDWREAMR